MSRKERRQKTDFVWVGMIRSWRVEIENPAIMAEIFNYQVYPYKKI
jgi:hypothetical protein